MNYDLLLSPHFKLRELLWTVHSEIDNEPMPEIVYRLTQLCNWVLEPIRVQWGPLRVSSGYRSPLLNAAIKGSSSTSLHMLGCCADVVPMREGTTVGDIMRWLASDGNYLPFDQAIDELDRYGNAWLHVGLPRPGTISNPRRELLTMRSGVYEDWSAV